MYGAALRNCILIGNSAVRGGGTFSATLNNSTLTGNIALDSGGGAANCTLNNCVVYFNSAGVSMANYAGSGLNYCCTTPLPTSGVGNIDADPQLASAARLSSTSPCGGAGSPTFAAGVDIDGEPWANPPCIGADQLTPGSATGEITLEIRTDYTNITVGFTASFVAEVGGRLLSSVWDWGTVQVAPTNPTPATPGPRPGSIR